MSFPSQNITMSTGIAQIPENVKDAIVGELSTVDDDLTQTFTYSLIDNTSGHFKVDGRLLKTAEALDYEANTQFTIRIKTTDSGSPPKSYERDMIVYVQDINEKPTALHISHSQVRGLKLRSSRLVRTYLTTFGISSIQLRLLYTGVVRS